MMLKKITAISMIAILASSLVACNTAANTDTSSSQTVTASQSSQSSQEEQSSQSSEQEQPPEKTVVSKQNYPDCDGSGHGYYEITYSDGTTEIQEY